MWDFITQKIDEILRSEEQQQNALEKFARDTLKPDHPFYTTALLTFARYLPKLIPDGPFTEGQD